MELYHQFVQTRNLDLFDLELCDSSTWGKFWEDIYWRKINKILKGTKLDWFIYKLIRILVIRWSMGSTILSTTYKLTCICENKHVNVYKGILQCRDGWLFKLSWRVGAVQLYYMYMYRFAILNYWKVLPLSVFKTWHFCPHLLSIRCFQFLILNVSPSTQICKL